MQRLTEPVPGSEGSEYRLVGGYQYRNFYQAAINLLGRYEDTGMQPEEIIKKLAIKRMEVMAQYAGYSIADLAFVHQLVTKQGISPQQLTDIRELAQTIYNLVVQEQERALQESFDRIIKRDDSFVIDTNHKTE